ncbi:phycobilisome rod-core linker polypeptide [Phormidium sp. CLA17]|uniref:phycobilisome rod-core linker polypeptide n=1 Tax=Leptolyngbya sp. Cla-17 TaxID=2803751 RepID=UPI0014914452|nr:phycobilisome rod-core linker polypeptide [Leptolyngbya sp. Cla-17]MBM0743995.1 phycobilisome rod-core linker polypeptide [Leptolyngbya sp. Cla-17]
MTFTQPTTTNHSSSLKDREIALHQIYQQILERQPYGCERTLLATIEKDFLTNKIGVKRFVKEFGQSEPYLNTFYYTTSNLKFLELCFKHFLGRAPQHHAEIRVHFDRLVHKGVKQLILDLVDSEEYLKAFGCFTVPHPRQPNCYLSPNVYLESNLLNEEQIGRRGRSLPTLYWRQLGLHCDSGVCHLPETYEDIQTTMAQEDLSQVFKLLQYAPAEQVLTTLSPQQKAVLRQAIIKST